MSKNFFRPNRSVGFTLIELMISIAFLVVVVTLAVPSLNAFLQNQRISTTSQAISNVFTTARSEALNRVNSVDVCWIPSGGATNTVRDFDVLAGQMVVLTNDDPAVEVASVEYDTGSLAILDTEGTDPCITYTAQGRLDPDSITAPLVFRVCLPGGATANSESVSVQLAGRAVVIDNVGTCV